MTPLDAALAYAAHGWRVVPILPGTKRPAIDDWVNRASTAHDWVQFHFTVGMGVGIVTGQGSGIFVLDVDPKHAGDETLADLEHEHGKLPETVRALTPSGGEHIYFRMPDFNPGTGAGKLGPGLDIRAEGGQVVAPPTDGREWQAGFGFDEIPVADAPGWLLELLKAPPPEPRRIIIQPADDDRPGTRWSKLTPWPAILEADGARCLGTRTDRKTGLPYEIWSRPGVGHTSATLGYGGTDLLKIHSSNWTPLEQDKTYSKFGYMSATKHGGDDMAMAAWCKKQVNWGEGLATTPISKESAPADEPEPEVVATDEPVETLTGRIVFDDAFWRGDSHDDWLVEPFLARGRSHALYAPAKVGKSLLALEVAAALATGRATLEMTAGDPIHVLYVDFEMTADDVRDRLREMGYGPADDELLNAYFHYHLHPILAPLDTVEGGNKLVAAAVEVAAELVIIDTVSRVISGEENKADTVIALTRHTFKRLKALGITTLRLDHSGKNIEQGQRGTSAKNDDVDVVWRLTVADGGFLVTATHRRLAWVPEKIVLKRHEGPLRCEVVRDGDYWPPGTTDLARLLDELGVPLNASRATANAALTAAEGHGRQAQRVDKALAWRRDNVRDMGLATNRDKPPDKNSEIAPDLLGHGLGQAGHETPGNRDNPVSLRETRVSQPQADYQHQMEV